jgi:hypothetical protein
MKQLAAKTERDCSPNGLTDERQARYAAKADSKESQCCEGYAGSYRFA